MRVSLGPSITCSLEEAMREVGVEGASGVDRGLDMDGWLMKCF